MQGSATPNAPLSHDAFEILLLAHIVALRPTGAYRRRSAASAMDTVSSRLLLFTVFTVCSIAIMLYYQQIHHMVY